MALAEPRQRILIADAVGLGKTLEAGVLMSELIRRGKGKRILVVTLKSMMTQFQKELWARFTIPLTRLDSVGIQRMKHRIPTNHNPLHYFDKAIISIDTLKQDGSYSYRAALEQCSWDIIVIDEAHNVAERGSNSKRAKLAKLLASRSDTLIMLSATPHDGRAESFASLMNMLNPTAIANPSEYTREDIKGMCVRRFKHEIQHEVKDTFPERKISRRYTQASSYEEAAFAGFADLSFARLDQHKGAGMLVKTVLEKALFSSPAACLQSIESRCKTLNASLTKPGADTAAIAEDIASLESWSQQVSRIGPESFSKYQSLLDVIQNKKTGLGWSRSKANDRLVIFTERIETLKFLHKQLLQDLTPKLSEKHVAVLHGGLSDKEQQAIVDDFGNESTPLRLLLASDVASEGINLHYQCHRMIHFDLPWSLMSFQQRNGRIDRYGQTRQPHIVYLITQSDNDKIRGDLRILELLTEKDEQAAHNIGDPSAFMGVYDMQLEEAKTARAIEQGLTAEEFEDRDLREIDEDDDAPIDMLALLGLGDDEPAAEDEQPADADELVQAQTSLYDSDYTYCREAIRYIKSRTTLQADCDDARSHINLVAPADLWRRLAKYLNENDSTRDRYAFMPKDREFVLSANVADIAREIERARTQEDAWPQMHLLWELHPVVEWINDQAQAAFGRHVAPVLSLPTLPENQLIFLLFGTIPNRKSHPVVCRWFGVRFTDDACDEFFELDELLQHTGLGQQTFPSIKTEVDLERLQRLVPTAIEAAQSWISDARAEYIGETQPKIEEHRRRLEALRKRRLDVAEQRYLTGQKPNSPFAARRQREFDVEARSVDRIFKDYARWVEDTLVTEDAPYIRVVAALQGRSF